MSAKEAPKRDPNMGEDEKVEKDDADVKAEAYEGGHHDRAGKDSADKAGTSGSTKVHSVRTA